jgi:hypothetical protein
MTVRNDYAQRMLPNTVFGVSSSYFIMLLQ